MTISSNQASRTADQVAQIITKIADAGITSPWYITERDGHQSFFRETFYIYNDTAFNEVECQNELGYPCIVRSKVVKGIEEVITWAIEMSDESIGDLPESDEALPVVQQMRSAYNHAAAYPQDSLIRLSDNGEMVAPERLVNNGPATVYLI